MIEKLNKKGKWNIGNKKQMQGQTFYLHNYRKFSVSKPTKTDKTANQWHYTQQKISWRSCLHETWVAIWSVCVVQNWAKWKKIEVSNIVLHPSSKGRKFTSLEKSIFTIQVDRLTTHAGGKYTLTPTTNQTLYVNI